MLKIQIISNKKTIKSNCNKIFYSAFGSPKTFDLFDINIIDLQDENLWENNSNHDRGINRSPDLKSLSKLIDSSHKSKTIILFPQNYTFKYYKSCGNYSFEYFLKDKIENIINILSTLLPQIEAYDFIYENAFTLCGESAFMSAFCFSIVSDEALTSAIGSNKATTMQITDYCILTTLSLAGKDCKLEDFLEAIGLTEDMYEYPQWLVDFEKFDDKILNKTIKEQEAQIIDLQKSIKEAQDKLQKNLRLKSILTENGNNLVAVVFDILEDILCCDLSEFKDKKKEDFLIKLSDCTFIGEIKGINTNVKNANVSQLDVHYQNYLDDLADKNTKENLKALLIINPQRDKPINTRDEVHDEQITLAKRNGSLIIPTITLLSIYEKFLDKQITSEQIKELFLSQVGLIDFKI